MQGSSDLAHLYIFICFSALLTFFLSILSCVGLQVFIKIIACPRDIRGTYASKGAHGFSRFLYCLYLVYILQFTTDLVVFLHFRISLTAKQLLRYETAVSSASSNIEYLCTKSLQIFTSEGHCSLLHNKLSKLIMTTYIYTHTYSSMILLLQAHMNQVLGLNLPWAY